MPMMPFIGVRISWLMFARNSLLARVLASAASIAVRMAAVWTRTWRRSDTFHAADNRPNAATTARIAISRANDQADARLSTLTSPVERNRILNDCTWPLLNETMPTPVSSTSLPDVRLNASSRPSSRDAIKVCAPDCTVSDSGATAVRFAAHTEEFVDELAREDFRRRRAVGNRRRTGRAALVGGSDQLRRVVFDAQEPDDIDDVADGYRRRRMRLAEERAGRVANEERCAGTLKNDRRTNVDQAAEGRLRAELPQMLHRCDRQLNGSAVPASMMSNDDASDTSNRTSSVAPRSPTSTPQTPRTRKRVLTWIAPTVHAESGDANGKFPIVDRELDQVSVPSMATDRRTPSSSIH